MTYLLASLYNETQSNRGLLLKKGICSARSKFFPLRDGLVVQGGKYDIGMVASLESVPIFSPIGQEYPFLQMSEIFLSRPAISA